MLVRLSTAISTAMGCSISRYGAADPLGTGGGFRKKFGQLQMRNDPSVVVTASRDRSTVPLLKEGASRDHQDLIRPRAKGKEKRKRKGKTHNKNNNSSSNNNNAIEVDDDDNEDRMTNGSKNEVRVVVAEGGSRNNDDDDDDEEEEEYSDQVDDHDQDKGRISDFEGIGSPSFREYCHCYVDRCDSSDGTCCEEDGSSTTVDEDMGATTINVHQGSVSKSKTMVDSGGKKGRRFIKVFSAGRSSSASAMKNFLHVTACYNPNSTK